MKPFDNAELIKLQNRLCLLQETYTNMACENSRQRLIVHEMMMETLALIEAAKN